MLLRSFSIILIFVTRETRHIIPPSNIAGILNFRLEFQISNSWNAKSSFSSYLIILIFLQENLGISCHPVTRNRNFPVSPGSPGIPDILWLLWNATPPSVLIGSLTEFFTGENRHIVPSCNKPEFVLYTLRIITVEYSRYCQILQQSAFWPTGQLVH